MPVPTAWQVEVQSTTKCFEWSPLPFTRTKRAAVTPTSVKGNPQAGLPRLEQVYARVFSGRHTNPGAHLCLAHRWWGPRHCGQSCDKLLVSSEQSQGSGARPQWSRQAAASCRCHVGRFLACDRKKNLGILFSVMLCREKMPWIIPLEQ